MPQYYMTVNKKRHPLTEAEYLKVKNTRYSNTTFEVIEDDPDLRNLTAEELIKSHEQPLTEGETNAYLENEERKNIQPLTEKQDKKSKPKK